jgi:hypothetical protein
MLTNLRKLISRLVIAVPLALFLAATVNAQECDFDDVDVTGDCPWGIFENETLIHMHDCPSRACYKFYRSPCPGSPSWTLIYEGPNNEICDEDYAYGACVRYKGQGFTGISGGGQCTGSQYGLGESLCPGCSGRSMIAPSDFRHRECFTSLALGSVSSWTAIRHYAAILE